MKNLFPHEFDQISKIAVDNDKFQNLIGFPPRLKGLSLANTIDRFYLPGNSTHPPHTTQLLGVTPNIEVYSKPNPSEKDKRAYREEDSSPIVLPAKATDSTPLNANLNADYDRCIKENGVSQFAYEKAKDASVAPDYQRLVAFDAVVCAIRLKK